MRTRVSDLRLGDCLAEHPLIGSVIALELQGDGKSHITFINESDVLSRDVFTDAEIRTLDDTIELLDSKYHELRKQLIELFSEIENADSTMDPSVKMKRAVVAHAHLRVQVDAWRAARDAGTPWPKFLKDMLQRNTQRLLEDLFELDEGTATAVVS